MIHRIPFFLPWLYPTLTWKIPTDQKEIYLTFDDGPVPGVTEFVLDTLKAFNAKATFFCIGDNVRKHPDIYQKILDQDHAVGNHTFNHLKGWKYSTEEYVNNIRLCDELIRHDNQHKLFRPPYGRIKRKQITALSNYKIIMWDVLTMDYRKRLSAGACLQNSIDATRPGSIVVFHDSYKAEKNLTHTLPGFLRHFSAKGFSFKSIS